MKLIIFCISLCPSSFTADITSNLLNPALNKSEITSFSFAIVLSFVIKDYSLKDSKGKSELKIDSKLRGMFMDDSKIKERNEVGVNDINVEIMMVMCVPIE